MSAMVLFRKAVCAGLKLLSAALLVCTSILPAQAASIYASGAMTPLGTSAPGIAGSTGVSDPFSVTTTANLTDASIVVWVTHGSTPQQVSWAIGTAPYGTDVSSGTSTLSHSLISDSAWDLYQCSFPVSGSVLPSQNYYFTLHDGQATGDNQGYISWGNQDGGPSNAYFYGMFDNQPSQYFALNGEVVPEPATMALAGAALFALVGIVYYRRRL